MKNKELNDNRVNNWKTLNSVIYLTRKRISRHSLEATAIRERII